MSKGKQIREIFRKSKIVHVLTDDLYLDEIQNKTWEELNPKLQERWEKIAAILTPESKWNSRMK